MEFYKKRTVIADLDEFDVLAKKHSFVEVSMWNNGEGVDIALSDDNSFSLTFGQLKAIKKLVKLLDKHKFKEDGK